MLRDPAFKLINIMKKFKGFRFHHGKLTDEVSQNWESFDELLNYWREWDKKQFKILHPKIDKSEIEIETWNETHSGMAITFKNFVSGYNFEESVGGSESFNYVIVQIN